MTAIEDNSGMLGAEGLEAHPDVPRGAAPGFAASAFVEWSWGAILFVFGIGWLYGFAWQHAVRRGGIWTVHYTALMALSVFFIAQSFLAVLFRYLLIMIPSVLLWEWAKRDYANQISEQQIRMDRPSAHSA